MRTGSNDPADGNVVVNDTAPGMNGGDPPPVGMHRLDARPFVGERVPPRALSGSPDAAGRCAGPTR